MSIEINSVWDIDDGIEGVTTGQYRCLRVLYSINALVFFQLNSVTKLSRPILVMIDRFLCAVESGEAKKTSYTAPDYILASDSDISLESRVERDYRFSLIEELIDDDIFYLELCSKQRSPVLRNHAKEKGVSVQTLYRTLNKYWRYGQDRMALLSANSAKGAKGKSRSAGEKKRGLPVTSKTGAIVLYGGVNITSEDKEKIKKGLKKYYLKKDGEKTLIKAYEKTLCEYYSKEIERAELEGEYAQVPTYRQFLYWKKQLVQPENELRSRTNESDYQKNKRALLGSVIQEALFPGDCFEIDATVLDVHVVSPFHRNKAIGRPTLYMVADKASRMIVGLHVSMEYASWEAARQALVNSFISKVAYCKKYGIDISDSEWPCKHIPKKLLCDRGEMVCAAPEELVVPLMELAIAAPYRADMKGVIESRFKIVNDDLLHSLIGTTRGKHYVRGDADPRYQAMYTLDEITEMLILEVLEHNRRMLGDLATSSQLLIENDLFPNPINYWNIHLAKHRHSLKTASEDEIRAKLLPSTQASMTRYGVECNDMFYSCEKVVRENLSAIARANGCWQIEARVDRDNSSFIYVKFEDEQRFIRCDLLPRSAMLKDLPLADIYYFQDWKKSKEQKNIVTTDSIRSHNRKKEIEKESRERQKAAPKNKCKSDKVSDMRARRRQAILDEKERSKAQQISQVNGEDSTYKSSQEVTSESRYNNEMLALLKRKDEESNDDSN